MENKSAHPQDYMRALKNMIKEDELEELLKVSTPIFLFGPLMLPQMLKSVTDAQPSLDIATSMTQACLPGYELWVFEGADIPVVRASGKLGQSVDGLVVFGLSAEQRNWIYEFEAENAKHLTPVSVEICTRDGVLRTIDAATFVWKGRMDGLVSTGAKSWKIDTFLQSELYQNATRKYSSS
ncbi:hypothetical protein LOZ53_001301 [Ophidiomyces ophidiicola]|uniref:Uncharacterized protein n=1 Tax=Ophidiomyces ophidiicola TaxID=1387563 RepID=A0ACB8V2B9_9EURO|nr:hypothetical protein LOZ64_002841 [Ophidiomyces ophidiicola]KAI1951365.1 hypothetical protein LOZ62_001795 [Ophidiomyces ophidiicola]KAI1973041.1 hypothetical protein LOZ56_002086 [Ophidiomyces ophidiicola]KAI1978612.1 hypothetical protein LOZ55_002530 [Ophidiomyces ophidiicola]KAI1991903.1 hypothetical protein LOZ51_004493 [Ophidiomyces ophidiicola]